MGNKVLIIGAHYGGMTQLFNILTRASVYNDKHVSSLSVKEETRCFSTSGADVTAVSDKGEHYRIDFCDAAFIEKKNTTEPDKYFMAKINANHIIGSDCIVYCIDIGRLKNTDTTKGYIEIVGKELDWIRSKKSPNVPIILVGTKSDLLNPDERSAILNKLLPGLQPTLITSAKENMGIDELLARIKSSIPVIKYEQNKPKTGAQINFFETPAKSDAPVDNKNRCTSKNIKPE